MLVSLNYVKFTYFIYLLKISYINLHADSESNSAYLLIYNNSHKLQLASKKDLKTSSTATT